LLLAQALPVAQLVGKGLNVALALDQLPAHLGKLNLLFVGYQLQRAQLLVQYLHLLPVLCLQIC
jgi:hypothetical protein